MEKTIKLSIATTLILSSLNAQYQLEDIIVTTAIKTEQSIKDVTSDVTVITREELEERHYNTVSEALNSVSGINVTSNGGLGQSSAVRINGMHYNTTLVLIDGIRYNDITNGSAFLENILVSDLEQIEIIKGAQSGIWGADASGGVINIITKNAKQGTHGTINSEYGSFNTKKYGASISHKEEKYYFKINTQKLTSDGFTAKMPSNGNLDNFEDDGYKNKTNSLKAGIKINNSNKIDFTHTIIDSEVEYDGSNNATDTTNSTSKSKFSTINFNHINNFNKIDIYINKSTFDRRDPTGYTPIFIGEIKEIGLKSNVSYNKKDFLIIGIDKKDFSQEKGYLIKYKNEGMFLTNSNFINSTIVTQSLRYDKYNKFQNKNTGKLGIKHSYNNFTFITNYGTGYKAPSLYELSNDGGNKLKPELTKSFDISTKYKDINFKYFKNKINDLLTYNNNNTPSNYSDDFYENGEGASIIKGYEINYQTNIKEDTIISFNYTNLDAKDKNGNTLGRVAEELFKVSVDYYGIDKLHININSEYVGNRFDFNGGPNAYGQSETGNYTVINSTLNYKITPKINSYIKLNNLTDKYYQTVNGYATANRSFYVGFNASF